MKSRGGGIINIELINCTDKLKNYYKIKVTFNTADSMGANFINSCLEEMSTAFLNKANEYHPLIKKKNEIKIIMSILSNYVPKCIVKAFVKCSMDQLSNAKNIRGKDYIEKFISAGIKISDAPIKVIKINNEITFKDGERGTGANLPISFTASSPYPNPFKNEISFSVTVLKETFISITIFDLLGREIRYIYDGRLLSGRYDYKWDSKNNIGVNTASGTYFIKISDGTNQEWKTITLIR